MCRIEAFRSAQLHFRKGRGRDTRARQPQSLDGAVLAFSSPLYNTNKTGRCEENLLPGAGPVSLFSLCARNESWNSNSRNEYKCELEPRQSRAESQTWLWSNCPDKFISQFSLASTPNFLRHSSCQGFLWGRGREKDGKRADSLQVMSRAWPEAFCREMSNRLKFLLLCPKTAGAFQSMGITMTTLENWPLPWNLVLSPCTRRNICFQAQMSLGQLPQSTREPTYRRYVMTTRDCYLTCSDLIHIGGASKQQSRRNGKYSSELNNSGYDKRYVILKNAYWVLRRAWGKERLVPKDTSFEGFKKRGQSILETVHKLNHFVGKQKSRAVSSTGKQYWFELRARLHEEL